MGRSLLPKRRSFSHNPLQIVSLCGISTPFDALSRTSGQMSYVLLTRAPLSTDRNRLPVRLACVRHAANVHPEPGSNSPYDSLAFAGCFHSRQPLFRVSLACCFRLHYPVVQLRTPHSLRVSFRLSTLLACVNAFSQCCPNSFGIFGINCPNPH